MKFTTEQLREALARGNVTVAPQSYKIARKGVVPPAHNKQGHGRVASRQPSPGRKTSKTEAEWGRILQARMQRGEFAHVGHEEITLLLGHRCRYTPDYMTVHHYPSIRDPKITLWEVKGGFIREDAMVKLKVAASRYPFWRFMIAQKVDGEWTTTEVRPE